MPELEYDYDEKGNIKLPPGPPFDGKPVLVKTAQGWVEAWWEPALTYEGPNGREYEGFQWVCFDDEFQRDLDDVTFWLPLPESP